MARLTAKELLECKGKRRLTMVAAFEPDTAEACALAGIDMIGCTAAGLEDIRKAAPSCFIRPGLRPPFYQPSDADAIRACCNLMAQGADAIYMAPGLDRIRAVARADIPVFGHVGFVPWRRTWIGGNRAVGKTAEQALKVYRDALAIQEAGALGVEIELVPNRVAIEIARRLEIFVISIACGPGVGDCELLFACDILGSHNGHYPRHAKVYRNHFQDSVNAFKEFKRDVESQTFPEKKHQVDIKEDEFERFMGEID